MSIQTAFLDYIRLATWDVAEAAFFMADMRHLARKFRDGHWLQYKGFYGDKNLFYGHGNQAGKPHFIFRMSGWDASQLHERGLKYESLYCTRLDIQKTIEMPDGYNPFHIYDVERTMNRKTASLIHSDTGSTIYIGTRTSDRFCRLYEKQIDGQEFLRLEFEFKGKTARELYNQLRAGVANENQIFDYFMTTFSFQDRIEQMFLTNPDVTPLVIDMQKLLDRDKQLAWLSSLENTVIRMGNDHDIGDVVRRLLESWVKAIDNN